MAYALKKPPAGNTPVNAAAVPALAQVTDSPDSHCNRWLAWQCKMMNGAIRAGLFSVTSAPGNVDAVKASWPQSQRSARDLLPMATAAILRKTALIKTLGPESKGRDRIDCYAIPVPAADPKFVLVMLMNNRTDADRGAVQQLVTWGAHWLEVNATANRTFHSGDASPLSAVVDHVVRKNTLRTASMELVGQLASHLSCERVSIGFNDKRGITLQAVSGLSSFDHRMQLAVSITSAMQEALERDCVVQSSDEQSVETSKSHKQLADSYGGSCVSIPVRIDSGTTGVLTLEKNSSEPWPEATIAWCERVSESVALFLHLLQLESRNPFRRLNDNWTNKVRQYMSPEHTRLQIGIAAGSLLFLLSLIIHGEHRVSAVATIEGADKQVIVAPQAGFILSASARAGETVEAGQVIARLDDHALLIERDKWQSELNKLDKSYTQALAQSDRTELSLLQARKAEINAELQLVEARLERGLLIAPFRGVIVSGDLHQKLGAPVEAGQVLFEVASMEKYRLLLEVDDHKIATVKPGQAGTVRLSAMPGTVYETTLGEILPVAVVSNGKNVFRLEADFNKGVEQNTRQVLRPGMQGVAKINVGKEPLFWLWTHSLFDRLRVWFWSLGV